MIFIPFSGGKPNGEPVDVLTGFLNADGQARGRPVGVALDSRGGLLWPTMLATSSGASTRPRPDIARSNPKVVIALPTPRPQATCGVLL